MPAAVYPPAIGAAAQARLQPRDRHVERTVEVAGTGLCAYDRAARDTGDLQALAVVGLARVAFMEQFDVDPDQLAVVPFDLAQLVGDVRSVMVGHLDVSALDNDVHA